jgi:hypothetical protein
LLAEREQLLKLAAVRRLRALVFLVEAFENFVALSAAVLFTRAKLRWQTEVLGLLLRLPTEAFSGIASEGRC